MTETWDLEQVLGLLPELGQNKKKGSVVYSEVAALQLLKFHAQLFAPE